MSSVVQFIKRLFTKEEGPEPGSLVEELWIADLSGPDKGRFLETDEASHRAAYVDGGLELELKKSDLFAWTEAPLYRHGDFGLEAELEFEEGDPYSACGLLFRLGDDSNFYAILVSNRGYIRLDAVFNGRPRTLVPWTECPAPLKSTFSLRVVARGPHIIAHVDGEWVLEAFDDSFRAGYLALAGQDYGEGRTAFRLSSLLVEARPLEVEAWYYRFNLMEAANPAARQRLAASFLATGEWLQAAVQLRKAEKAGPLGPDGLLLKAEAALRLELHEEAEEAIDACLAAEPGRKEAQEEKADILYLRGRYPELRAWAQDLLAKDPENARLWTLLGHARFNLGDYVGSAADYARAAALEPDQPLCRMNEARAREQSGDRQGAARAYLAAARGFFEAEADDDLSLALSRLEELDPRNPELAATKAKVLFRRGHKKEAKAAIGALIAAGSRDSALFYLAGLLEVEGGRRMKALPCFEKACELEPAYPLYAFRLAESLFLLGRPEAAAAISHALELEPAGGWTTNLAAMAILAKGEADGRPLTETEAAEARRLLETASAALPGRSEPAVNLAELESLSGRHDAALAGLATFPEDAAARNQAGNVLVRQGRLEEAAREYRKAIGLDPAKAEYRLNLAALDLELEFYSDAEEQLRKAMDLEEGPRAYLLAGNLALVFGDWVRAEAAYRVGLELSPSDGGLLLALARTYLGAHKAKKAEDCLVRLEGVDPARAARFREEYLAATTETLNCASCGRTWRLPRDLPAQSGASVRAMPPDEAPAGACPRCGKVFCIACRKADLKDSRFTCPDCGEALKLQDNRLRYLVRESLKDAQRPE